MNGFEHQGMVMGPNGQMQMGFGGMMAPDGNFYDDYGMQGEYGMQNADDEGLYGEASPR